MVQALEGQMLPAPHSINWASAKNRRKNVKYGLLLNPGTLNSDFTVMTII
jgi:hypothetical protein